MEKLWNESANFGVVKIGNRQLSVYRNRQEHMIIVLGDEAVNAVWAGRQLNVTMRNGTIRSYSNFQRYETIY